MESQDIIFRELWELESLGDALDEEPKCFVALLFECKSVDMDERKLNFCLVGTQPDRLVSIIECSDEAVQELYCIDWQVHVTVIKSQKVLGDCKLGRSLIVFIDQHAEELPRVHVERKHPFVDFIQRDVLLQVLHTLRI